MKRFLVIAVLFGCFSCLTEESADPGKPSTFVRYYNGGFDDFAQTFEQTPDEGFIILATTQVTDLNVSVQRSKIKLIKTDRYGNTEWQMLYPAFTNDDDAFYSRARGLFVEKDDAGNVTGFAVVGDSILRDNGAYYLFILETDASGNYRRSKSLPKAGVSGQAITKNSSGDYLVLASHSNSVNDMVLTQFDRNNLSQVWSREYGSGESGNIIGLLSNGNGDIYWGGTVRRNGSTDIRFVKTIPDSETGFDWPIGSPDFNEEGGGMCPGIGGGFAIVGTTDENGNSDILYKQIGENGIERQSKIIGDPVTPEQGNDICATRDGGLIIIGTSGIDDARDYNLIKVDFTGEVIWSKLYGSQKADRGVRVMQTAEGQFAVLGATTLGGLNAIMLMKTDAEGNIE